MVPTPMTEATARGLVPRRPHYTPQTPLVRYSVLPEREVPGPSLHALRASSPQGGGWLAGLAATGAAFLPLAGIALLLTRRRRTYRKKAKKAPWEIRRISLAFDWTARGAIQAELDRLAAQGGTGSPEALARLGKEAAAFFQAHIGAARHGLVMREPIHEEEAEAVFLQRAADLRSRFREEIVNGAKRIEGLPPSVPRPEEGEGLVVVSIVAGVFTRDRSSMGHDRAALAAELGKIIPQGTLLGPLELIWSPADPADRMSSLELEALYPELIGLDGEGAQLGRRECGFCGAAFAAELGVCPACGAPEELT